MKSKYNAVLIVNIFLMCFFLNVKAQSGRGYELTGHIEGLKDGDKILMNMMVYNPGHADEVTRDSALVKNGRFHISGYVPNGPRTYWLRIKGTEKVYRMYIDNDQQITIDMDNNIRENRHTLLDKFISCTGSPSNYAFHQIWMMTDGFDLLGRVDRQLEKSQKSLGYNKDVVDALMAVKRSTRAMIGNRLKALAPDILPGIPLLVRYDASHDLPWDDIYNQMDQHLRKSIDGQLIEGLLPLLEGKEMPAFALPDQLGNAISLKDITAKSKVTIVRFWAKNSYNRKASDEELRAMYKLYHSKGLNIVAVSSESYEEQWKETLAGESYPWYNVFDKKGQKFVDPVYHELGEADHQNTTNVVLDSQGKIVAWDVAGIQLQYYILSTLGE